MNRRIFAGIVLFALLCAMLTGCGGREKVDLNGAASLADLRGATLGAQTGTFHLQALEQVEGVTKKDYADFTDLLNALRSGAIDGYVAEEPTALEVCGKDDTLTYLPFRNNENGFTDTERSEAPVLDASGSTENGVFRIAMECAYAPFNWTQTTQANGAVPIQGQDGMYANGYDVQVAKYVAAQLGMALEVYAYPWDSLIPAVQSGAVDAVMAGMSPTAERALQVDFTDCYYNSNLVIIIRK